MWGVLNRRTQVLILVALTACLLLGIQAAEQWWTGERPPLLKAVSFVATIVGSVMIFVANKTWRWAWRKAPFLNQAVFPDLNGKWTGTFQTTWVDPDTGTVSGPIDTEITIRQGILAISVRQRTGESNSWSNRVLLEADPEADRYRIWYSYTNKPKAAVSHRSSDHDGIAWLEVNLDEDANELSGQYFTSRRTSGDIKVTRRH